MSNSDYNIDSTDTEEETNHQVTPTKNPNDYYQQALIQLREGKKIRDIIPGKKRFENYLRFGLNITTLFPDSEDEIGVYWYNDTDIAVNKKIFAEVVGFRNRSIHSFFTNFGLYKVALIKKYDKEWIIFRDRNGNFTKTNAANNSNFLLITKPYKPKNIQFKSVSIHLLPENIITMMKGMHLDAAKELRLFAITNELYKGLQTMGNYDELINSAILKFAQEIDSNIVRYSSILTSIGELVGIEINIKI